MYKIWDHAAYPGPDYWDFKCLVCSEEVKLHAPWPLIVLKRLFSRSNNG